MPDTPQIPASEIPRFYLSSTSFRSAVVEHRPLHIRPEAIPYLVEEDSFSAFVLEDGQEQGHLKLEEATKVGTGAMQCPMCNGRERVQLLSYGRKTGLRAPF